jgi:hypothetical protein
VRALCTPRRPTAYAEAVRSQCSTDLKTLKRWSEEWRTL